MISVNILIQEDYFSYYQNLINYSSLNESLEVIKIIKNGERERERERERKKEIKSMKFLDDLEYNCDTNYKDDSVQSEKQNLLGISLTLNDVCKSNWNYWQLIDNWGFS